MKSHNKLINCHEIWFACSCLHRTNSIKWLLHSNHFADLLSFHLVSSTSQDFLFFQNFCLGLNICKSKDILINLRCILFLLFISKCLHVSLLMYMNMLCYTCLVSACYNCHCKYCSILILKFCSNPTVLYFSLIKPVSCWRLWLACIHWNILHDLQNHFLKTCFFREIALKGRTQCGNILITWYVVNMLNPKASRISQLFPN